MASYGVWKNDFIDNDTPEYFSSRDDAFDEWHRMAETDTNPGESVYFAKFDEDGDIVEGTCGELRNEDGDIREYDERGNFLWL